MPCDPTWISYFHSRLDELYQRYAKTGRPRSIFWESDSSKPVTAPSLDSVFWERLLPISDYCADRVGVITQVRSPLLLCSKLISRLLMSQLSEIRITLARSLIGAVRDAVESSTSCDKEQKCTRLLRIKSRYYRSVSYTSRGLSDEDNFMARLCEGFYTWACRSTISQHSQCSPSAAIDYVGIQCHELGQDLLELLEGMDARLGIDSYCSQAYKDGDCEVVAHDEITRGFQPRLSMPHRRSTNPLWIDMPAR